MRQSAKFIVVAGGEGSGKTTCLNALEHVLPKDSFTFTREPGGTDYAEAVRAAALSSEWDCVPNSYEQLLNVESTRSNHVRYIIRPALDSGKHVLCDRFSEATFAYQVHAGDRSLDQLFHQLDIYSRTVCGTVITPTLWIFLDVEPRVGLSRARARKHGNNVFDRAGTAFHCDVREGHQQFFVGRQCEVIDTTNLSVSEVHDQVLPIVLEHCGITH